MTDKENVRVTQEDRDATAKLLGYRDWDDATDYRLTGAQDQQRDRTVLAFARHREQSLASGGEGFSDGRPLSFKDAERAGAAMFERWRRQTGKAPPFREDDAAWADLYRAGFEAIRAAPPRAALDREESRG